MQQNNKNIQNNEDIAPIKETKELPKNPTTEEAYEKKATRSEIQNELIKDMGITIEDLEKGKDIKLEKSKQYSKKINNNKKFINLNIYLTFQHL